MGSTGIGPQMHYTGPGLEPQRKITLVAPGTPGGDGETSAAHVIDPADLSPGIDPTGPSGQTFSSPPPADPDAAARVAGLEQRMGELVQALGAQRQDYEQKMQEQRFRYEAMFAAAQTAVPMQVAPQNDFDPDEPVKAGQMIGVLNQWNALNQAQMIRAIAQISPQEEAAVIASHPYLANVPEPKKSELLKEAVLIQRSASQAATANDGRATQGNGQAPSQSPRVTRPAQRVVPTPEYASQNAGGMDEPIPVNNAAAARAEYEAAQRIPDKKERLATMKTAMQKAAAAQGISPEALARSSWRQ